MAHSESSPLLSHTASSPSPYSTTQQNTIGNASVSKAATPHLETYSTSTCTSYAINYIVGCGLLGIPYGFYHAGLAFGIAYLLFITFIAIITVFWLVEVASRAEAVVSAHRGRSMSVAGSDLLQTAASSSPSINSTPVDREKQIFYPVPRYEITMRKFEINDLCEIFAGRWLARLYVTAVGLYFVAALCSYASVFAQSFASHVPMYIGSQWVTCDVYTDSTSSCQYAYLFWLAVFALCTVPMTCRDLQEQKLVQVALTCCRFVAVGLMTVTSIWALYHDPYSMSKDASDAKTEDKAPYYASGLSALNPLGVTTLVPVLLYSQVMHHSTPGLMQPLKSKWPAMRTVVLGMYATTLTLYTMIGVSMAVYYGDHIEPTASLNFGYFRGGASHDEAVPWWATLISYFVVLFPALDVLSAYPLNALSLANNMMTLLTPSMRLTGRAPSRKRKTVFRILAALPPIAIAIVANKLDVILRPAGLVGFAIIILFPATLQIMSRRMCKRMFGAHQVATRYTWNKTLSGNVTVGLVTVVGIVCMLITIVGFFDEEFLAGK